MHPAWRGRRAASPWRGHGDGSGVGSQEGAGNALSSLGFGATLSCLFREGLGLKGDLNCCVQLREESVTAGSVCTIIIKEQLITPGRDALLTRNSPRLRLSISVRAVEPQVQASCGGNHGHAGAVPELGFISRWAQSHGGADPELLLTWRHVGVSLLPAVPRRCPARGAAGSSEQRPTCWGNSLCKRLLGKFLSKRAAAKFSILYF